MTWLFLKADEGSAEAMEPVYTNNQYVNAIFWAEGGYNAKFLYGIRSISYENAKQARHICLTTIKNNRKRFKIYGYRQYPQFIQFLASRYCPTTSRNLTKSEKRLNGNWERNVEFYLKYPKKV